MNKKFVIISLIIIALFGSLLTFYASNLFFSDVANFGAGFSNVTLFATLPAMLLGAIFIAAPLYIVRLYKRPENKKALSRLYLIIACALSVLGLIFAVLAGVINYRGNFVSYPFPGYLIIMMVVFALIIACSIFVFFKFVKDMPEDNEKFKGGVKHVLHTIGLYLLIALAFNRCGAFLLAPVYIQWSNLYKTFVYYLFLLIPMALLVVKMLKVLDLSKNTFIPSLVVGILNIVLMVVIVVLGSNDSSFISAVSAAAPLERLGSMPMEILIHFFAYLGVSIYYVIVSKIKKN
jgi:MFS family permease